MVIFIMKNISVATLFVISMIETTHLSPNRVKMLEQSTITSSSSIIILIISF